MGYKNNLTFAIRTLLLYRYFQKDSISGEYTYTLAAGTLLNVLSAALESNDHFKFDFDCLKNKSLPHLDGTDKNSTGIKGYLSEIWEALSKKTDGPKGNFTCEKERGDIVKITLHSKEHSQKIDFSDADLNTLLDTLEDCIKKQYAGNYAEEEPKFTANTRRQRD